MVSMLIPSLLTLTAADCVTAFIHQWPLCVFSVEGRRGEDGHKLCSRLWSRHREDHQTFAAASVQHRGPGGCDAGVPG